MTNKNFIHVIFLTILGASLLVPFSLAQQSTDNNESDQITTQSAPLFTEQTGFQQETTNFQTNPIQTEAFQTNFAETTQLPVSVPDFPTSQSADLQTTNFQLNSAVPETGNPATVGLGTPGSPIETTAVPEELATSNPAVLDQFTTQNFEPQTTNNIILTSQVIEEQQTTAFQEVIPTDALETLQPPEGTTVKDTEEIETTTEKEITTEKEQDEQEPEIETTQPSVLQTSPTPTQELFTSPFQSSVLVSPVSPQNIATSESPKSTAQEIITTTPDDNCEEIDVIFTVQNSPASQPWDNVKQLIVDFIYKSQNKDNVRWSFLPYSRGQPAEEEIINWTDYCKKGTCNAQDFADRVQAIPASFDRGATLKPALNLIERDMIPKRRLYAKLILVFIVFSKPRQSFEEELKRIYSNNVDIQLQLIHIGDKSLGEEFETMENDGFFGNIQKLPSVNRGIPVRTRQTIVSNLIETMLIEKECLNFGAGTPTIIPLERTKASEIIDQTSASEIVVEKPQTGFPDIVIEEPKNETVSVIDDGVVVTTVEFPYMVWCGWW